MPEARSLIGSSKTVINLMPFGWSFLHLSLQFLTVHYRPGSSILIQMTVQFDSPNQPYLIITYRPLSCNRKLWRTSTLKLTLGLIIFAYLCYPLATLWIGYISEWMWNIYFCVRIWLFTQIKPLAKNCESLTVWISLLLWRELSRVLCSIMQESTDQNRWVPDRTSTKKI